jgi:glutamate synthase domain-containing protein 3
MDARVLGTAAAGARLAAAGSSAPGTRIFDLETKQVRDVNAALHAVAPDSSRLWRILNPNGKHAIAAGIDADIGVEIDGHVGYYCAGMNKRANLVIHGNAGVGVAENMMSGRVHVKGDASQSAGATAHGGLLVIDGNASARCGISMKGVDIVVKGSIGHMSAFMAQAGSLVVLGDAGEALGDSIYEAQIFLRGTAHGLGADCVEKEMRRHHVDKLRSLLQSAGVADDVDIGSFRRYGSARRLYHFHVDNASAY